MDDIGEFLVPYLPNIRVPRAEDRVFKDECCLSFDTPYSEEGLYVCLNTFLSFSRKYVQLYHEITRNSVFLHLKKVPIPTPLAEVTPNADEAQAPSRLAIGVEGGFTVDPEELQKYEDQNSIVILPDFRRISIDRIEEIPAKLLMSVQAVLSAESASKKEDVLAWDGDIRSVSVHSANLKQLDNGVRIPPSGWQCSRCDLTANLWANLTDGSILCGRRYYDGSGGNEHALEHFKETGYPLVVKLGTITASGADVYSYAEDNMVEDPNLAKHLEHFGINMMSMEKTDKTMTELEIDINQKIGSEWNIIQESGKQLKPMYGPCATGMKNLGNSCYMNSAMQVLCSVREISDVYQQKAREVFQQAIRDPAGDFNAQMVKLVLGISSGDYSHCPPKETNHHFDKVNGISPKTFKRLIGKGHPEFSTGRQQDAQEYLLHILSMLERNSRLLGVGLTDIFKFSIEERIECVKSKMVRYSNKPEYMLGLPVSYDFALNREEVKKYEELKLAAVTDKSIKVGDPVRAQIPFSSCLESFMADEVIEDFWSPALQEKSTAKKRTRFSTFPDYLIVQLMKFAVGEDWVPKKLDVEVDVPDVLDLEQYRGKGLQEAEKVLPDVEPQQQNPASDNTAVRSNIDEASVSQLIETGFPPEACRKAVYLTGNCGAEIAMTWLMEHISDPDFADPVVMDTSEPAGAAGVDPPQDVSEDSIGMIIGMGFTRDQAIKALKATNNNLERAADWIFSHLDELDTVTEGQGDSNVQAAGGEAQTDGGSLRNGAGKYELFAFISHMGTSTMSGHYVCHIKKDGKWVIFNDAKVAESEAPPKKMGYLYFYKRIVGV